MRTSMVESVHPGLTIRLRTFDRADIMRFSIVVPSQDLDDVKLVPTGDDRLPALSIEMLVREENPLHMHTYQYNSLKT